MNTLIVARAIRAALIGAAFAGAPLTAYAEVKNYEFQLMQPTVQAGADRIVETLEEVTPQSARQLLDNSG